MKFFRRLFHSAVLATASLSCIAAGFQEAKARDPDGAPLDVAIWYPSNAPVTAVAMGPISQSVALGGPVKGVHLPLIVISHGTGGYNLSHYDTAIALADAGFVVAAVTHTGDNYRDGSRALLIMERPRHISRVIDFMLHDWSAKDVLDADRVGAFGHSAGGFTTLVNVGGHPDLLKIMPFCRDHATQFVCRMVAKNASDSELQKSLHEGGYDARIKAAVVAVPALGFTFVPTSLANIHIPVQLWRAELDEILPSPWYAQAVHDAMHGKDDYRVVENAGHFDFLAPCSEALQRVAPAICSSAPGFNRAAFHARFNAALVDFFKSGLS